MNMKLLALTLLVAAISACTDTHHLPDDGFVDVPGGRVAFRVVGEGNLTPVLWIHGGPGGSSCGAVPSVVDIARNRPVILYDQLGSGYSDRIIDLEQYARLPRFVEEIVAIRDELGLQELHLVGHSWGNAVALEYLLTKKPAGIRSVVFASPFFGTERWIADANQLLEELPVAAQAVVAAAIESGDFASSEFKAVNDLFLENFGMRTADELVRDACKKKPGGDSGLYEYMWGPTEFVATGTLIDYNRIDRLPELDLPVLFVTGQYDEARPETVRHFQGLVEGSRLEVLPDAGHAVYVDQQVLFNATLVDFFADVEAQH